MAALNSDKVRCAGSEKEREKRDVSNDQPWEEYTRREDPELTPAEHSEDWLGYVR